MAISLNFGTFILNSYFVTLLFDLYTYWYRESKIDIIGESLITVLMYL